jgi:RNA polymerase sigma-70 factor (ECF subfamily)
LRLEGRVIFGGTVADRARPGVLCNNRPAAGFYPAVNTTWLLPFPAVLPLWRWLMARGGDAAEDVVVTPARDDDAAWLECVGRGDESALQYLFDKWKRPLLGFFYRSLGSHADAEDLTLEVFVRLHRAARDYRREAKFSTFLFHIARNLVLNEHRRRQRKPADAAPPEVFDSVATGDVAAERRAAELEEILRAALARLPEKYRTPLLLLHQQQMDYPTAAATLHVTENSLRVLVHRGRELLRTEMEALQ